MAAKKKAAPKVAKPHRSLYVSYDDEGMISGQSHPTASEAREEAKSHDLVGKLRVKRYTLTEVATPGGS